MALPKVLAKGSPNLLVMNESSDSSVIPEGQLARRNGSQMIAGTIIRLSKEENREVMDDGIICRPGVPGI
jgi:hypothetical protein